MCNFRYLILVVVVFFPACLIMDTGPDPVLVSSCKISVADAAKSLKKAEQLGHTLTSAYIQSYKLITQAKRHLIVEKYSYCLQKASLAQRYLGHLLTTGKDI